MPVGDKIWDALTTVIKMNDKLDVLGVVPMRHKPMVRVSNLRGNASSFIH